MSNVAKNIMVRVIKSRLAAGETFEDIIKSYPRLTTKEVKELKNEIVEEGK